MMNMKNSSVSAALFSLLSLTLSSQGFTQNESADSGFSMIEEIVVTARHREETLQDVPVAVSAYTGEQLEAQGLSNAQDLFSISPGLYFSQAGQRNSDEQFYLMIRGVGSSPVVEPSVGVFVDGMYMPTLGWTLDFLELERVEVLRGPQGALFGRNTEAGALNVITRKPDEEFRAKATLEAAEFDTYKGGISVSGKLTDNLFAGFTGFYNTTDGYMNNVTRGEDQDEREKVGARLSFRVLPSDSSDILLTLDYTDSSGHFDAFGDADPGLEFRVADPNATTGSFVEAHPLAGSDYTTFADADQEFNIRNYGVTLNGSFDVGFATVTSISGYRNVVSKDLHDIDGLPITTGNATNQAKTQQEIFSQEIRLASNSDGPLSWIAGIYGFVETLEQRRLSTLTSGVGAALIAPGFVSDNVKIDRDGFAVFGQLDYAITEQLIVTAGLRYSYETVDQFPDLEVDVTVPTPAGPFNIGFINDAMQSKSFSGVSPSGSIKYHWNEDVMTYASITTGFKGGGFTKVVPNTPAQNQAVDNETSLNYEIGIKADLLDNRLRINASIFRSELEDQQLNTRVEVAPGVFAPTTTNAGEGLAQGFELEAMARPVDELLIRASVAYVDTEFEEYIAIAPGGGQITYDRSGQSFPEAPEWMGSVSAEYRFAVENMGIDIVPMLTWRYVDDKFIGEGNASIPFIDIPSYDILDAQLSVQADKWSVTAYAKNLTDEYYVVNKFLPQIALAVPGSRAYRKPGAPRQIGVRLVYNF